MTFPHPRVITVVGVLVGISALVALEACTGAQRVDDQRALADQGNADGRGVPQDFVAAHMWTNLAA